MQYLTNEVGDEKVVCMCVPVYCVCVFNPDLSDNLVPVNSTFFKSKKQFLNSIEHILKY